VSKRAEEDYTHKKQTGGSGQFARIKLVIEPNEQGKGFEFENKVVGGNVPKEYIPGVQKGLESARNNGVIAGFPVIDFKASLIDGAYHDVDSSVLAFEIAARAAFREGMPKAVPKLLEPLMKVEVVTPEEYMGDIIGDLNSRRGKVLGAEPKGTGQQMIRAHVPMAEVLRYAPDLRSMTSGRGDFELEFSHYEETPPHIAEKIIKQAQAAKADRHA
jgi:elongation factor G